MKLRQDRKQKEKLIAGLLTAIASLAVAGVFLIMLFVFREGSPIFLKYGFRSLIFGGVWLPESSNYGMLPLIIGSLNVTLVAILLGVPFGVGCAVFLEELASPRVTRYLRPAINLLAGIPSIVYGFFGLVVLVPFFRGLVGGTGFSLMAGGIILAIMILPTIISISEDALKAVPGDFREASLALGATHWQTIYRTLIPAAKSGILAAVILGIGRAVGETMAVIMITGNTPLVPRSILDPGATLTGTIGQEWSYATGEHAGALFGVGIVLFIIIALIDLAAAFIGKEQVLLNARRS